MNRFRDPIRNLLGRCLALLMLLLVAGLSATRDARAQSFQLEPLWSLAPGDVEFLDTGHLTRGLAYNPATGHLLVVSRTGTAAVHVLDSATGAYLGTLPFDSGVVAGGTFPVNMIGITDDGVIYVGNLTTDANDPAANKGPFRLYRWDDESALPALVYVGDPSNADAVANNRRFGDSLVVRGTGVNTQILLGTTEKNVAVLSTADGFSFDATKVVTDAASGDMRWGLAWGAGDAFWAKQAGGNLKQFTLNLAAGTAALARTVTGITGAPLALDVSRGLLGVVEAGSAATSNHKFRLYDISDPAAPQQQDATRDFPGGYANGNLTGAVALRGDRVFALESNNGLMAFTLTEVFLPPAIATPPANVTVWEGAETYTFTVGVSGSKPLTYQWRFDGVDIPGATASTLTLSNIAAVHQGGYSVVVNNAGGSATSAAATLTVTPSNPSPQVENLWNVLPGTRPYLTSGYKEYGVAINPATTNVIVLTRPNPTNMIAVLDMATGAHKHYIDYSGLTLAGGMNKLDVADDGVIYICNLSTATATTPFTIYGIGDDSPYTPDQWLAFSGDPGNGVTESTDGWGANIDVRGGGLDTEILVGAGKWSPTTLQVRTVAILKPNENYEFISTPITVPDAPANIFRFGLAWGPGGNTFWVKAVGNLYLVEFDLASGLGTIKATYPTTGARSVPSSVTGIKYDPAYGLLAGLRNGSPPTPVSVPVYDVTDVEKGPLWVDNELFTTYNADIEYQGNVDFGAGYLVALGVNNGLKAFKVNAGAGSSLPVILTHPADATCFAGTSVTLRAAADSATPISYQWYFNGTEAIPGATSDSLTLNNVQLDQAGQYSVRATNASGSRDSWPATLTVLPLYQTAQMANIWTLAPGSRPYLTTAYQQYGMAFNPATSNLLIVHYDNVTYETAVAVLDALTGAEKHFLDVSMVWGGNRYLNKIGVADDGVVYAANRTTAAAATPLTVYRWADDQPGTIASIAFNGDPFPVLNPNKLCGWTMEVRGAGLGTEILLSTDSTNVVSILTTTDGFNFTPNEILVAGAPANFARLGIAWGVGNTFWVKTWQGPLYLVEYNLAAGTGTILRTYGTDVVPATVTTLSYNDPLKFLAGVARDDQKNVLVYSVANLDAGPKLLDQEVFPTSNPSIEANGALDFGGNQYLFALNENNGVMAFLIDTDYVPPTEAFSILSVKSAAGSVTLEWEASAGTAYQVQSADALGGAWQNLGSPVLATGATASYVDAAPAGARRFYRIQAK
ncbi:MAG TPA: immunoglobulin domain-containing protein [Verrucomicrobiota bacterium]|nr:immunoglobulin domain-containing protein [Verrucomicrobiota bacterium]HNU49665.1 immunoglobulin domain-containing protein [Verrucomicrobiota bacterium]